MTYGLFLKKLTDIRSRRYSMICFIKRHRLLIDMNNANVCKNNSKWQVKIFLQFILRNLLTENRGRPTDSTHSKWRW